MNLPAPRHIPQNDDELMAQFVADIFEIKQSLAEIERQIAFDYPPPAPAWKVDWLMVAILVCQMLILWRVLT